MSTESLVAAMVPKDPVSELPACGGARVTEMFWRSEATKTGLESLLGEEACPTPPAPLLQVFAPRKRNCWMPRGWI